jgi:hypothetical protein
MQLQHNTTEISFYNPSTGDSFVVLPGNALYNPQTGYIVILKISDGKKIVMLQLLPRTESHHYRNRAIAEAVKAVASALSAGFLDEITGAAFGKMTDLTLPAVADAVSDATASQKFGYYDMQTKDLVFDFPIRLAL